VGGRSVRRALVAACAAAGVAGCAALAGCSADQFAAPPAAQPPPPVDEAPEPSRVVVAVDALGSGFNPHLLAHRSPVTTAVAALVLPSVFRPDAQGVPQLDTTVVTSARVSATEPFTVTYEIDLRASWSSNAPIAAEDFVYLWQRMRSEPGVAGAAGYRLITDVRSRAGGKAVDVLFAEPYESWQHLFTDLLPAHILKDAPGSWTGALTAGIPASGGPFRVVSVDRARGEIVLGRNDLYWARPSVLDQLVLRRVERTAVAAAFAADDVDVALTDPGLRPQLQGHSLRMQLSPQPVLTQLALRLDTGPLAQPAVRRALAGLVDRAAIRAAVGPQAVAADAFGHAPSEPGYASTVPPLPDAAEVQRLLTGVGWARDPSGAWTAAGAPVRLVVGAAVEQPDEVRVARLVAAQLTAAGIETAVVTPPAVLLYGQPGVRPDQLPDQSDRPDQARIPPTTLTPAQQPPAPGAGAGAVVPQPTAAGPTPVPGPDGTVRFDITVLSRPVAGVSGVMLTDYVCAPPTVLVPDPPPPPGGSCLAQLRPLYEALLTGVGGETVRDYVEGELWQQVPALPLYQPVTLVVSTPAADTATAVGPGPLATGPLTGAQRWAQPAR